MEEVKADTILMKALKAFERGTERMIEIEKTTNEHTERLEKGKERILSLNNELDGVQARFDSIDVTLQKLATMPHANCNYTAVSEQLLRERMEREKNMAEEKNAIVDDMKISADRLVDIQYSVAALKSSIEILSANYGDVKKDLYEVDKEKAVAIAAIDTEIKTLRSHLDNGFQQKLIERLLGMEAQRHMTRKQIALDILKVLSVIFGSGGFAVLIVELFQKH